MTLSPEIKGRIEEVETRLAGLDPILHEFCSRTGYTYRRVVGVWPRRKVWAREDVDRPLDLVTDLSVPEVQERGFYPDMPWSLVASASLVLPLPGRLLSNTIFQGVPFSTLAEVLAARLEEGLAILGKYSREDILTKGETVGNAHADTAI